MTKSVLLGNVGWVVEVVLEWCSAKHYGGATTCDERCGRMLTDRIQLDFWEDGCTGAGYY